jgi:hypothetical protein
MRLMDTTAARAYTRAERDRATPRPRVTHRAAIPNRGNCAQNLAGNSGLGFD